MINEELEAYLQAHSTAADAVLQELYRKTNLISIYPRMLSGELQGKFLEMICQMLKPERVLEIGTFTGYSAISMARGLPSGGLLTTIEANEELEDVILKFLNKANVAEKVRLIIGDAKQVVPELDEQFDLVFIDADKASYPLYYSLVFEKVKPGGFILADNVLWAGKVADPNQNDFETNAIRQFNDLIAQDERVEQVMLPLRDGLLLIRKCS